MRKTIVLLVAVVLSCKVFAYDLELDINRAEKLYEQQSYDSVIDLYNSVLDKGLFGAEIYYNLGNAYFKNNNIAFSILYYEKALLLAPNDEQIQHNLAFANSKQVDKLETISTGMFSKWYASVYRFLGVTFWSVISIILFLAFLVGIYIFLFSRSVKYKKLSFFLGIFVLFFSMLTLVCANSRYHELTSEEYAIIVEPTVSIKTEPNYNSKDLTVLHAGLKVFVVDQVNDWYSIRLADGKQGWIAKIFVERI